jgi:hypothetical protein
LPNHIVAKRCTPPTPIQGRKCSAEMRAGKAAGRCWDRVGRSFFSVAQLGAGAPSCDWTWARPAVIGRQHTPQARINCRVALAEPFGGKFEPSHVTAASSAAFLFALRRTAVCAVFAQLRFAGFPVNTYGFLSDSCLPCGGPRFAPCLWSTFCGFPRECMRIFILFLPCGAPRFVLCFCRGVLRVAPFLISHSGLPCGAPRFVPCFCRCIFRASLRVCSS